MEKTRPAPWWVRARRQLPVASIAYGVLLAAGLFAYGRWRESSVLQWAAVPGGVVAGVLWGLLLRHDIVSAEADAERSER